MRIVAQLALFLVSALALVLLVPSIPSAASAPGGPQEPPAAPVEVATATERDIVPTMTLLGTLEPRRRSVVATAIEGYVIEYSVDEGQHVDEGTVLTRLRDRELRLELDIARHAADEARALHKLAQADLDRARKLVERDAVTQKALDAAETEERALSLRVPQAEARARLLELDIEKKEVRAPFKGQVVAEHTEVGEFLPRGGPVATIVDLASVRVRVNVPERIVRFLRNGAELPVVVPATGREPYQGRVISISGEGATDARTFPVLIEIENDGSLRAGMSARVDLPAEDPREAVVVPKDAIIVRGTQSFVFVVGPANDVALRPIVTGAASRNDFEVASGLNAGEIVVTRGNERIQPGMKVRILSSSSEEAAGQ